MAKKDSITIDDKWIDLTELALPAGLTAGEVEKLLEIKPIKVSLEVILPKGATTKGFDYEKNADVKKFKSSLESKVGASLAESARWSQFLFRKGHQSVSSYVAHRNCESHRG